MRRWNARRFLPLVLVAAGVSLAHATPNAGRETASAPLQIVQASEPVAAAYPPPPRFETDIARLRQALDAARRRDVGQVQRLQATLADPVARKLVDWAYVDVMADQMPAYELEAAIRRLDGWPREETRRRALARARLPAGPVPYTALGGGEDMRLAAFRAVRLRMIDALNRGDGRAAYAAIAAHGQAPGSVEYAEGESYAGWLALKKLRNPALAEQHFARLAAAVSTPVSLARAAYWRGRAAEQAGDPARARTFYEQGAAHLTTFYGQLAAQRAGRRQIVLAPDPTPTARDRQTFERAELSRALRLLADAGERNLVRVFALHYGDVVETQGQLALLMDELRSLGEQEASLLAYRRAARHDLILNERGYPMLKPPSVAGGAEPALVLAITRQESQFDPRVRSRADARGMMQILPETGRLVARRMGVAWSDSLLWDPQANMRLGSRYLGELTDEFQGSYVLAAAGYNAGPRRMPQWIQSCGDPRAPSADPLDFIECIPFGETRNYVMNVMANYQVYKARLNGGRAQLTAEEALRSVRHSDRAEARSGGAAAG